jgi:hypothetical protein
MAEVQAFVWHDQNGNITAVGQPTPGMAEKIQPLVHGNRHVLKLSIPHEYLSTLHLTHKIDLARGKLAPRKPGEPVSRSY